MVFAKTSGTQSVLAVTKPDAATATAKYLVSYGLELTPANEALGAAVYADPICLETKILPSLLSTANTDGNAISATNPWIPFYNCYNTASETSKNIVVAFSSGTTNGGQRGYVNAIELAYLVPFKVPNDRTEGKVTCALSGTTPTKNWLNVHAASVMSTGFGIGSCWYFGKDTTSSMDHRKVFLCRDLGEVASGSTQKLAFQFSIW